MDDWERDRRDAIQCALACHAGGLCVGALSSIHRTPVVEWRQSGVLCLPPGVIREEVSTVDASAVDSLIDACSELPTVSP